jgi:hypothetical protein
MLESRQKVQAAEFLDAQNPLPYRGFGAAGVSKEEKTWENLRMK